MKVLITGVCGFTGNAIANALRDFDSTIELCGIDNFVRAGSEVNRGPLQAAGLQLFHGDMRCASDFEQLPKTDWVIDAAANPSVLAGVDGNATSRQVLEHNLIGTLNVLEYARRVGAGIIMLSTSRVYSIAPLAQLPVIIQNDAYRPDLREFVTAGLTEAGVTENFPTRPPISLYGATKLASEMLTLEYGESFDLPVWINRCGVLAGAGQFGKPDQGIFAFWINSYLRRCPLSYIGFDGAGHQVRDCLHPRDVAAMAWKQMQSPHGAQERVQNVSGGRDSAMSLAQLSAWCAARFGEHSVGRAAGPRRFDVPWLVLDSTLATKQWTWQPTVPVETILEEIAQHAEEHPEWLAISAGR